MTNERPRTPADDAQCERIGCEDRTHPIYAPAGPWIDRKAIHAAIVVAMQRPFNPDSLADAVVAAISPTQDPATFTAYDPADDMCPNCLTPWKCNGPHLASEE